jgi:hypothetical protein
MCSMEDLAATRFGDPSLWGVVPTGELIVLLVTQVRTLPIACAVASESPSHPRAWISCLCIIYN